MSDPLLALQAPLQAARTAQFLRRGHDDDGAVIHAEWGVPDAGHLGTALLVSALLLHHRHAPEASRDGLRRCHAALAFLRRCQRPSGRLDLRSCNFDSGPDTAFAVQQLASAAMPGSPADAARPIPADLRERLDEFLRPALAGIATGGFHTPNHRWVVAGALALGSTRFPDLAPRLRRTIQSYIAEGPDQDGDGAWLERSPVVYDAVTNRSLRFLADNAGWSDARACITRNLRLNRALLQPDGTADTSLSTRQDRHWHRVPAALAADFWFAGDHGLAAWIWSREGSPSLIDAFWWTHARLAAPAPLPPPAPPGDVDAAFPTLGLHRVRKGDLALSLHADRPGILRLLAPGGGIASLSLTQSYLGAGTFVGDVVRRARGAAAWTLLSRGLRLARRPGYELPLGRPVPPQAWQQALGERRLLRIPPAAMRLDVELLPQRLRIRARSTGGLPGALALLSVDVSGAAPGFEWISRRRSTITAAGTRFAIGPGRHDHRWESPRDGVPPAPGVRRCAAALVTPFDHALDIAWSRARPHD